MSTPKDMCRAFLRGWSVHAPFLMNELDASGADAGVVQWSVLGSL